MIISTDNDYIIEINKKPKSVWGVTSEFFACSYPNKSNYHYLFNISIKNNLNILQKELILTDNELYILLDNIYAILYKDINEVYIYFNCNISMINTILKIELDYSNNYIENIFFILYDYYDEKLNKLLKINMSNKLDDFINEILNNLNK